MLCVGAYSRLYGVMVPLCVLFFIQVLFDETPTSAVRRRGVVGLWG